MTSVVACQICLLLLLWPWTVAAAVVVVERWTELAPAAAVGAPEPAETRGGTVRARPAASRRAAETSGRWPCSAAAGADRPAASSPQPGLAVTETAATTRTL